MAKAMLGDYILSRGAIQLLETTASDGPCRGIGSKCGAALESRGSIQGRKMKTRIVVAGLLMALFLAPMLAFAGDHGLSLGFGFGAFNRGKTTGKVEGNRPYNFIQAMYVYEKPFSLRELSLLVEPFGAYVNKPATGFDLGFDLGLRYNLLTTDNSGLYLTAGPGLAYTTIGFKEQGTHFLFILEGGLGYKYRDFFIEDRFRHYSNGGTARPNWSVNANILSIGALF